ncbi:MAG: LLM class flavin-dependent oxidoreductase [Actinomycetota bacterium]
MAATVQWARRAEELGYHSLWVSDHFFLDLARYGGPAGHVGSLEPVVTLAAVASATTSVRLGTLVLSEAFRAPATLAKQATALDLLSNGRLDLGIGAGWYEDEYNAAGFEFPRTGERITRMRETLQILDAMLSQETSSFAGTHYSITEMLNAPQPVQKPRPPLWVGGKGGERMARIIARYADGWNTVWKWTVEAYEGPARVLDAACAKTGRAVKRSIGLYTIVSDDVEAVFEQWRAWSPPGMLTTLDAFREGALIGTAAECAETLKRFAALGVEEVIVAPGPLPFAIAVADQVETIASGLIPLVRDV